MVVINFNMTFLNLKQLVSQPPHMHGHMLDLILSLSDQDTFVDVQICDIMSYHALVKCSIAFPCQVAHIQNLVHNRIYHCINMCDLYSDLKNTSFIKSLASAIADLHEQYVNDLDDVLDRHTPLVD